MTKNSPIKRRNKRSKRPHRKEKEQKKENPTPHPPDRAWPSARPHPAPPPSAAHLPRGAAAGAAPRAAPPVWRRFRPGKHRETQQKTCFWRGGSLWVWGLGFGVGLGCKSHSLWWVLGWVWGIAWSGFGGVYCGEGLVWVCGTCWDVLRFPAVEVFGVCPVPPKKKTKTWESRPVACCPQKSSCKCHSLPPSLPGVNCARRIVLWRAGPAGGCFSHYYLGLRRRISPESCPAEARVPTSQTCRDKATNQKCNVDLLGPPVERLEYGYPIVSVVDSRPPKKGKRALLV